MTPDDDTEDGMNESIREEDEIVRGTREEEEGNSNEKEKVKLFYRSQMTKNYKQEENEIKKILSTNLQTDNNKDLKLLIYYKNRKLKSLFIKNNPNKPSEQFHVIYQYTCDEVQCTDAQACYIGHTTVTLKERFKQHASVKKHFQSTHGRNITGSEMLKNVKVITKAHCKQDLVITEALLIKEHRPLINIQAEDFNKTLKIFK